MIRFIENSSRWLTLFGQGLLCVIVLVVMADIVLRRSVGFTVPGTVDLVQLGVMASFYLALPSAFLHDANVGVDFITDPLPPRALAAVKAFAALVGALFMVAVAWYCGQQAQMQIEQGDKSQSIGLPIALYWGPLVAGSLLSVSTALLLALRHALIALGKPDFMAQGDAA